MLQISIVAHAVWANKPTLNRTSFDGLLALNSTGALLPTAFTTK
jgi:hypothetical protein